MLRAGALVVVGVAPGEAETAVLVRSFLHVALQEKMVRAVCVRMRLRDVKMNENLTDWISDRDFGISLLLLEGLSDDELESCRGCAGRCLSLEDGRLVVLWVPQVRLPCAMPSDVDVEVFMSGCGEVLGEAVGQALAALQEITTSSKKKRKVNNVMNQYRAARASHSNRGCECVLGLTLQLGLREFLGSSSCSAESSLPRPAVWLTSGASRQFASHLTLQVGLGSRTQDTEPALQKLLERLLAKAWEETRAGTSAIVRAGNLRPGGQGPTRVFLPRQTLSNTKASLKNRMVWVADLEYLQMKLQESGCIPNDNGVAKEVEVDFEDFGKWSCVVGEGRDQITLEPRLPALPRVGCSGPDDAPRVVVLVGPDLHRYVLIYQSLVEALSDMQQVRAREGDVEALRSALTQIRRRFIAGGLPLVRAWLGLSIPQIDVAQYIFGCTEQRQQLLRRASCVLRVNFSGLQQQCLLGINHRITNWSFIAGAGKTRMLLGAALMAHWHHADNLVCMCVATNTLAAELEDALVKVLAQKQVVRLHIADEEGELVDLGQQWVRERLKEAMPVETVLLEALDSSLRILISLHVQLAQSSDDRNQVGELVRWIMALRHGYLDSHVYSRCAEMEDTIMREVRILVVSTPMLLKLSGGLSPFSRWFADTRRLLLLVDELPKQGMEEIAAVLSGFDLCVLGGDRNQFVVEQRQTKAAPALGSGGSRRRSQPLNRDNAGDWIDDLAKRCPLSATSVLGTFQYRYGGDTVEMLKSLFPEECGSLSCPRAQPNTLVVPHLFADLHEDWQYCQPMAEDSEVRRSRTLFRCVLFVLGIEMVLAHSRARPHDKCQILIMWCLKTPLEELLAFLETHIVNACWTVHSEWGIEAPSQGYSLAYELGSWLQEGRVQCKAAQNAHGSNAEVSLWFLVRRRRLDAGYRGEQTQGAYLFEQCTRASLRQHIFCEDLRGCVVLPREQPFWTEGWELGVRHTEQFVSGAPVSVAKRTMKVLKLCRWLAEAVAKKHCVQSMDAVTSQNERVVPVFMRSLQCQRLIFSESAAAKRLFNRTRSKSSQQLWQLCGHYYDSMEWVDPIRTIEPRASWSFEDYLCPGSLVKGEWLQAWLKLLQDVSETPKARALPDYSYLQQEHASEFDWSPWRRVCVPTIHVHLLSVDRRESEPEYELSEHSMHYCNVCFPLATCLSLEACDANELIEALAKEVEDRFKHTSRAMGLVAQGASLSLRTGHHKKSEHEIGAARFVVSACASDRPAAILQLLPASGSPIRKARELFHWYCAQGLDRQHHLQQAVLARVRDLEVAAIIVQVLQERLLVKHGSVEAICKEATDRALLMQAWSNVWTGSPLVALPKFSEEALGAALAAATASQFTDCFPFIHALAPFETSLACATEVQRAWQEHISVATGEMDTERGNSEMPEPEVRYIYENWQCRVPPGSIQIPNIFPGKLLYGGLSPVLNLNWLRWRGVTHVWNCLGGVTYKDGVVVQERLHGLALAAREPGDSIGYIDWCLMHKPSRRRYLPVFAKAEAILNTPGTCLYVHCRSGRDRSVFTVFALLRLRYHLLEADAWNLLQSRVGVDGWPCANWYGKEDVLAWVEQVLAI